MIDALQSMYYTLSKDTTIKFFAIFKEKWEQDFPSSVKYLENSMEALLIFLFYPKGDAFHRGT